MASEEMEYYGNKTEVKEDLKEEVKDEQTSDSISPLDRKIIRQIEFYFGDVNLPKDKFIQEKITEDEGWVTLECLTTFNRLKMLSTDLDEIKNALKKSTSGLLEVHGEEYKIRRSLDRPVPEADDPIIKKNSKLKTLYMKGFPLTYSFDEIEEYLGKHGASTVFIKLRKTEDHKFKGSVFAEVMTQEEADKLLNNKELKCEGNEITVMLREDYFLKKREERKERGETEQPEKPKWKPGCVLHFKGVNDQTRREAIKELFTKHEEISWVDYSQGENQGHLRFTDEGAAQKAIDAIKAENDGKIIIEEAEVEVKVLEGEEEENFWKMAIEDDKKRNANRNQGRFGRGRGRGRGGRGGKFRGGNKREFRHKRRWEDGKKDDRTQENEHKKFDDNSESHTEKSSPAKKQKVEVKEE